MRAHQLLRVQSKTWWRQQDADTDLKSFQVSPRIILSDIFWSPLPSKINVKVSNISYNKRKDWTKYFCASVLDNSMTSFSFQSLCCKPKRFYVNIWKSWVNKNWSIFICYMWFVNMCILSTTNKGRHEAFSTFFSFTGEHWYHLPLEGTISSFLCATDSLAKKALKLQQTRRRLLWE